jgi:AAA15 family ATPase/GTPase
MINKFSIHDFKAIKELDLSFNQITLIGGKNSVGKTTVLEAIDKQYDEAHIVSDINPSLCVSNQDVMLPLLRNFEPNLKSLHLKDDVLYADEMPINVWGHGFKRCLAIATAMVSDKNKVILVDNIEEAIYKDVYSELWNFIFDTSDRYENQVIATTQSYEIIEAFSETAKTENKQDIGYIRLERNKGYQFNFEELVFANKFDMEIR